MSKFMNKKQLGVTIILISLMIVLVGAEKVFNSRIKLVALMNNNISELKRYEALDGKYVYDIPEGWQIREKNYPGDYIIYSNEFLSDEMGLVGYVQVISTNNSIKNIINEDKSILKSENITGYKVSQEKSKDREIQKIEYNNDSDKKTYMNVAYYIDLGDNRVGKISFACDKNKYKENYNTIFKVILESFKEIK